MTDIGFHDFPPKLIGINFEAVEMGHRGHIQLDWIIGRFKSIPAYFASEFHGFGRRVLVNHSPGTKTTLLVFFSFLFITHARAELAVPGSGSTSAPSNTQEEYCNNICPSLANGSGQLLGLSGSPGWSSSDDQWCANHNAQTSTSVMANPAPLGATVPTGSCAVAYYPGDTSCAQVTAELQHCQFHNSQVESYCMSYEAAGQANGSEKFVIALDIAATATCGTACAAGMATGGVNPALMTACNIAGISASGGELIETLVQKSSGVAKAIQAAGIAAGGGLLLGSSISQIGLNGVGGSLGAEASGEQTAANVIGGQANLSMADGGDAVNQGLAQDLKGISNQAQAASDKAKAAANKKAKRNACYTAAYLAALTGIRYYEMGAGDRTKKSSCNNIWNLQSSSSAIAGGTSSSLASSSGSSTSTGTSGTTSSGTSNSGSSASTNGSGVTLSSSLGCTANGGTVAACGQISAATAGGIMDTSGLGRAVAPVAQQLANSGLSQALDSGDLASALGPTLSGTGSLGPALLGIAQATYSDGNLLGTSGGYRMAVAANSGTSNGSFSGFNAPSDIDRQLSGSNVQEIGAIESSDIFHAGTDHNIFQIVSDRIFKVGSKGGI